MTIKGGKSFKDYKKELLKDPEVKQEYDALQKSYDIAKIIYSIRTEANLTQEQLAKRIGTKQANISRAEKGSSNITVGTLSKIAEATGYELIISVKPATKKTVAAKTTTRATVKSGTANTTRSSATASKRTPNHLLKDAL